MSLLHYNETRLYAAIMYMQKEEKGSLHILTNTCTTDLFTKKIERKVLLTPCLIEHIQLSPIKTT